MGKKREVEKFQYSTEFQESILKFTVRDTNGYKALNLYQPEYFDLIEHQVIAQSLKAHFKGRNRIPSSPSLLKELINDLYQKREWSKALTPEDKSRVTKLVTRLYKGVSKDGEEVLEKCIKFSQYIALTHAVENMDLGDFSNYDRFQKEVRNAISIGTSLTEDAGTFILKDIRGRQLDRKIASPVKSLPYQALNSLTNAGGYNPGAVIVLVDKAKGFKTGFLANIATSYLKLKKNVIIFDLENGEDSISMRIEQSIAGITKSELLSGEHDSRIQKTFRKWRRLKSTSGQPIELVVKRLPSLADANEMQYWLDYYYKEYGMKFEALIIDYVGLMSSISKKDDDFNRISDAYLDVKNLTKANNIEHTWTAHHVTRAAEKFRNTCYEASHLAKCIDIHRHVDALFGINQDEVEEEAGIVRLEVIDQRDGVPNGYARFFIDQSIQRVKALTHKQSKEFEEVNPREAPKKSRTNRDTETREDA